MYAAATAFHGAKFNLQGPMTMMTATQQTRQAATGKVKRQAQPLIPDRCTRLRCLAHLQCLLHTPVIAVA